MARRERYEERLKCQKCEQTGKALMEENETPPHHNGTFARKVLHVTDGFSYEDKIDGAIKCKKCGTVVIGSAQVAQRK